MNVGGNTINFADSYSAVTNVNNSGTALTYLTLLGGNAWNTGGTISESQSPAGFAINGFQIMLIYSLLIPPDLPIHDVLTGYPLPNATVHLGYGNFDGVWGDITEIKSLSEPASVPEPTGVLLIGLGVVAMLATRKRRQAAI